MQKTVEGFEQDVSTPALELGIQELEALETPGFWSNFKEGVSVSVAVSAVYGGVASAVVSANVLISVRKLTVALFVVVPTPDDS